MQAPEKYRPIAMQALREEGLEPGLWMAVRSVLFRPHDDWRDCCHTGCIPCMQDVGRAVDRTRELLDWAPGDELPPVPGAGS